MTLEILDVDGVERVRLLVEGCLRADMHSVIWNGLDDAGASLPDDVYRYRLVATGACEPDAPIAFEDTLFTTRMCGVSADPVSWGIVKARYR